MLQQNTTDREMYTYFLEYAVYCCDTEIVTIVKTLTHCVYHSTHVRSYLAVMSAMRKKLSVNIPWFKTLVIYHQSSYFLIIYCESWKTIVIHKFELYSWNHRLKNRV